MSRARLGDLIVRLICIQTSGQRAAVRRIIERMRRDVDLELNTVAPAGGTPTIAFAIKYTGQDPRTVAQAANMLASLYVVENSKIRAGQAVRTAEFLKTQLDDVKKELDALERRASEFNMSHIGELPQQVSANLASLERLNTQLRLNGENQVRAMDRRERFERQLADLASAAPATVTADPARVPGSEDRAKLEQQLEQLRRKYTDQYPEVIRVRAELADLDGRCGTWVAVTAAKPARPRPSIQSVCSKRSPTPMPSSRPRGRDVVSADDRQLRAAGRKTCWRGRRVQALSAIPATIRIATTRC
jgi:hypothetical protein